MGEDHDVFGDGAGQLQEQPEAALVVGDDKWADGVAVKHDRGGGLPEGRQADAGSGAVDTLEVQLAGQGTGFEPFVALDLGTGSVPAVALGLGQDAAPGAGEVAEGAAHVLAGRGLGIGRDDEGAVA